MPLTECKEASYSATLLFPRRREPWPIGGLMWCTVKSNSWLTAQDGICISRIDGGTYSSLRFFVFHSIKQPIPLPELGPFFVVNLVLVLWTHSFVQNVRENEAVLLHLHRFWRTRYRFCAPFRRNPGFVWIFQA